MKNIQVYVKENAVFVIFQEYEEVRNCVSIKFRSKKKENNKKTEIWNEHFAKIMKEKRKGLYAGGFSSSQVEKIKYMFKKTETERASLGNE